MLGLADGATALSDLESVRSQSAMFGRVASPVTMWRTLERIGPDELRGIAAARATARERAWAAGAGPAGDELVIDFDATLITTRADKQDAAPTWKRSYGHYPLLAMVSETNEILAGKLRPGNAGSNTPADHVTVLDDVIDAVPEVWQTGHQRWDPAELATHRIVVRADSAGATHWFADECDTRNLEFSFGYSIDDRVRDAISWSTNSAEWTPAIEPGGKARDGAEVIELTDLVNLSTWPEGTRLIVRRERPHPGAQLTFFDTIEGQRHTAFITNHADPDTPIAELELRQRQRARAEAIIRDTKACGLANLPFDDIVANETWMHLCFAAHDLISWAQRISLTGQLRRATPKTIRH